jgi:hypothetical protein
MEFLPFSSEREAKRFSHWHILGVYLLSLSHPSLYHYLQNQVFIFDLLSLSSVLFGRYLVIIKNLFIYLFFKLD